MVRRGNLDLRMALAIGVPYSNAKLVNGARIMATTKAREDIKNDLKTLKELSLIHI